MSLMIFDHIDTALNSLKRNRMRSLLTTLGIAIGIASITTILSLADGVTNSVKDQVKAVGENVAIVRPGVTPTDSSAAFTRPLSPQQYNASTLSEADIETVRSSGKNLTVAPVMTQNLTLRAKDATRQGATIVATTPEFATITDVPIADGEFISHATERTTAVIGMQLAIDLFGTEMPIAQTFTVRDQEFTVIGVLKRQPSPINYNNIDFNQAVIVNFESGKALHRGTPQIQQINVRAASREALPAATKAIESTLTRAHDGEKDFTIITGKDVAEPTNQLFSLVNKAMAAIAAISLLVGGIGVMNIMLVSVAERTREIGIRKAIGATDGTIVVQFLTESLLISLLGGVVGVALGILLAFSMGAAYYMAPIFSWQIALWSLALSLVVGVVFGLYPAIRASRKDPIESLRYYR